MFSIVSTDILRLLYNSAILVANNKLQKESLDTTIYHFDKDKYCLKLKGSFIVDKHNELQSLIVYFNDNSQKIAKRFNKKRFDIIMDYSFEITA